MNQIGDSMNKQDTKIQEYFEKRGYKIINYNKLKKYLEDNDYIKTSNEIINENIQYYDIKCPREFLNTETIVTHDNDYLQIDEDLYLNTNWLEVDFSEHSIDMFFDNNIVSFDFDINYIANEIINIAIENRWFDIGKDDIEWYLEEDINNMCTLIKNTIESMIAIDDYGNIKRR